MDRSFRRCGSGAGSAIGGKLCRIAPIAAATGETEGERRDEHAQRRRSARTVAPSAPNDRYGRIMHMIATDRCVILDGANGTELIDVGGERPEVEEHLWGLTAIVNAPATSRPSTAATSTSAATSICTNTWGAADRPARRRRAAAGSPPSPCTGWTSRGVRCGSRARPPRRPGAATRWPSPSASTATSTRPTAARRSACSARAFEQDRPDLILLETLVARAQLDLRHRRDAARHRPARCG